MTRLGRVVILMTSLAWTAGCHVAPTHHESAKTPARSPGGVVLVSGLVAAPGPQLIPRSGLSLGDAIVLARDVSIPKDYQSPAPLGDKTDPLDRNDLFVCVTRDSVRYCIAQYVVDTEPAAAGMLLRNGDLIEIMPFEAPELGTFVRRGVKKNFLPDRSETTKRLLREFPGQAKAFLNVRLFVGPAEILIPANLRKLNLSGSSVRSLQIGGFFDLEAAESRTAAGSLVQVHRLVDGMEHVYIAPHQTQEPTALAPLNLITFMPAFNGDIYKILLPRELPIFSDELASRATRAAVRSCLHSCRRVKQN